LLRISIWFSYQFAAFHVANRAVTLLLLLLRRCMKCFRVFFVTRVTGQLFALNCDCCTVAAPARFRSICRTLCTSA